ncbi:Ger(x)C family spore germination protein [Lysinibacillus fusiformis]|uniref:Ger(x)C family spore germination protein n=1 Tax=Lysinibacillus fusiformis TaxID=28031 RepID=UPI00119CD9BF|nr:Ger(x)C family spore germination protein [Lysinibacillus fusiformis]
MSSHIPSTIKIILTFPLLLMVGGCLGIKEIQSEIYVTSLGVDYSNDEYHLYFQAFGFNNVSGTDPGIASDPAPIVVGHGKGKTIQGAFDDIEKNSVNPLYYGHIQTFLISKNVLDNHLNEFFDFFSRDYYLRYNTLVYGFEDDINKLMNVHGLFYKPPILTFPSDPDEQLFFNSFISTSTVQDMIKRYYEPVGSIMVPSLKVSEEYWIEDNEPKDILKISGAYFISKQKLNGWVTEEELSGLDWFNKDFKKMKLSIKDQYVSLFIDNIDYDIKIVGKNTPKYILNLDVKASIRENPKNIGKETIEKDVKKIISSQFQKTFTKGLEIKSDIFNLSEKSYRFRPQSWTVDQINTISENSIEKLTINVFIKDEGANK